VSGYPGFVFDGPIIVAIDDLIQLMMGRSGAEKMHGHACIFVSCRL